MKGSAARSHSFKFTVTEADLQRWAEPLTISVTNTETTKVWTIVVPSRYSTKPHTIVAPEGAYDINFSAPHYRVARRFLKLTADENLGTIVLDRYPVITGTIRVGESSPVVGATISDRAKTKTQSDTAGAFQLEVTQDWPKMIEISYPGLGTKDIPIPEAQASTKLPAITMTKGSRLALNVEGLTEDADVDLTRAAGYKQLDKLRSAHIKKDSPAYIFEDVERGKYTLLVRGSGPLQLMASNLDVEEDSPTKLVRIEPTDLTIEVHEGEQFVSGAVVAAQLSGQWTAELKTDDMGRISTEVWQRGATTFAVKRTDKANPVMLFQSIEDAREATVRLDLPSREIAGRVVNTDDGSPIANAKIEVDSTNDDSSGAQTVVTSDNAGVFYVQGLHDGSHKLSATSDNYVRSDAMTVRLDRSDPSKQVTLRMSHGLTQVLHLATPAGYPIRDAMVVEVINGAATGMLKSDNAGQVTLHALPGSKLTAYAIPREGSFGVSHINLDEKEHTLVVPEGNASLEIRAADTDGKPVPRVQFLMWYDGELIPPDVADVLAMQRGLNPVTGRDGIAHLDRLPQGYFQLWPVLTRQEIQDVLAGSSGGSAPVQIGLKEGLNVATITFSKKP